MPEFPGLKLFAADAAATARLGGLLAGALPAVGPSARIVTLAGELGAGKTTLARALLRGLGVTGAVRSPTYTLVEPYEALGQQVVHLDLYRLAGRAELEALGVRDWLQAGSLLLVEWPERAAGLLDPADLACTLAYAGSGRELTLEAGTEVGAHWVADVAAALNTDATQSLRLA